MKRQGRSKTGCRPRAPQAAGAGVGRRRFLGALGRGSLALVMAPVFSRCGEEGSAGGSRPSFRFAIVSDTHLRSDPEALENRIFAFTVEVLNAHDPPIDFVVATGDIVDALPSDDPLYYEERTDTPLHRLIELRDRFSMPIHAVMGNHDYYTGEGVAPLPTVEKAERERLYMERLGMPAPYYAFEHEGVKFYCLNTMQQDPATAHAPNAVGTTGPEQTAWLASELRDRKPAFFLHHHAIATDVTTHAGISSFIPFEIPRADGHFPKYEPWAAWNDYTDPIYGILDGHRGQVKACFFGHSHLFLRDEYAGVPLFMTNSMKFPSLSSYEGKPMRYHIVECEAGTGAFTIYNEYMISYTLHGTGDPEAAGFSEDEVLSLL